MPTASGAPADFVPLAFEDEAVASESADLLPAAEPLPAPPLSPLAELLQRWVATFHRLLLSLEKGLTALVSNPGPTLALWGHLIERRLTKYRAAVQMFVGIFAATLLCVSPASSHFFRGHGTWLAITCALALEPNVGATSRKATLRAAGTVLGGTLALNSVLWTAAFNGGWEPGADSGKVFTMAVVVGITAAGVQHHRKRHPEIEYAFTVTLVTLTTCSLSNFTGASLDKTLSAVSWRIVTILTGGLLAFSVSNLVVPEYASSLVRASLAEALRDAAALLAGTVDAYLPPAGEHEEGCKPARRASFSFRRVSQDLGGRKGNPRLSTPRRSVYGGESPAEELPSEGSGKGEQRRSRDDGGDAEGKPATPRIDLNRKASGFNGLPGAGGVDAGLLSAHAELHALELRLAKSLEKLTKAQGLLHQASVENRVRFATPRLPVARFTTAAASCRSVFTGAVTALHSMESGLHLCALCALHAPAIRAARFELAAAYEAAAAVVEQTGSMEKAAFAADKLEDAVAALAADVASETAWRTLLSATGGDATTADALRQNVLALGAVCFALGDAARQLRDVLEALEPPAADEEEGNEGLRRLLRAIPGRLGAPGGSTAAEGGGAMGAALRAAAHALDGAMHWQLAREHGGKEGPSPPRMARAFSSSALDRLTTPAWARLSS